MARWVSSASRSDSTRPSLGLGLQFGHVGRRGRRRRSEERFENPLAALHDRGPVGVRGHRQDAALSQEAAAARIVEGHLAELGAVDVRDAVVLGEPLVEERVIASSSSTTLRSSRRTLPKNSSVSLRKASRRPSSYRERRRDRASTFRGSAGRATGRRSSGQRVRARVVEHPAHLLLEHRRILSACPWRRGRAARHPECCSTGRTRGARPARNRKSGRRPESRSGGVALHAEEEAGETSIARRAFSMPRSKSPSARPDL